MSCWRGDESFHQCAATGSFLVLVCNAFMSGVGRFVQLRSANAIAREEKWALMPLFALMLDAAALSAFALRKQELAAPLTPAHELKRRIAEALAAPELMQRQNQAKTAEGADCERGEEAFFAATHFLIASDSKNLTNCCFCTDAPGSEKRLKAAFSSSQRGKGRHASCFAFRRFPEAARRKIPAAQRDQSGESRAAKRRKGAKPLSASRMEACALPLLPRAASSKSQIKNS